MVEKDMIPCAVIDLGTNTFNLLIGGYVNKQLVLLHKEKAPVLLGMGGINSNVITSDAMDRAQAALIHFKEVADKYKVRSIQAIGTSALRDASNAQALQQFAKEQLGIEIVIISGDQEAAYIFRGVDQTFDFKRPGLIMDIGGGSTEFIQITGTEFGCVESMDIGVSRIYQWLNCPEEISEEREQAIVEYISQKAGEFFNELHVPILIGSSGSFETIYEMIYKRNFPEDGIAHEIELAKFLNTLDWIISSSLQDRLDNEWIVPIRKKMLPVAAVKIKWVLQQVNAQEIFVSPYSLKEGVLSQIASDIT